MTNGQVCGFASMGGVNNLPDGVNQEVLNVYTNAPRTLWQIGTAFALAGFLAAFAVKQLVISRQNDTKFRVKEQGTSPVAKDTGNGSRSDNPAQ